MDASKLCFWQSRSFRLLVRKAGKLIEEEVGASRPKDAEFIRGGRRPALARAKELWPDAALGDEGEAAEGDVLRGEKPDRGKPLEDEEPALVSERPERISPARGSVTGSPFVRITRDTLGKHGLPR